MKCWNKSALELFVNSEPGQMEIIEDLVALRFFENGCPMHSLYVGCQQFLIGRYAKGFGKGTRFDAKDIR